jgi:hypothetical protein
MICAIPRAWCGRPQEPTSVWGATSGKPHGDTKTTLAHPAYAQRTHHEGKLGGQRTAARIQSAEVMEKPPPVTVGLGEAHRSRLWRPSVFDLTNHPTA